MERRGGKEGERGKQEEVKGRKGEGERGRESVSEGERKGQ